MTNLSTLFSGGIPVGDKIRFGTATNVPASSETTVLNVASGGLTLWGFVVATLPSGAAVLDNIKVTVDGASERTLDASAANINLTTHSSGAGYAPPAWVPLPIKAATSLTVKFNISTTGTNVVAIYSVP